MADRSKIERIDGLSSPPVKGRRYLVPTVSAIYCSKLDTWPVMGQRHEDIEHLQFHQEHFHIDLRFVSAAQERTMRGFFGKYLSAGYTAAISPMSEWVGNELPPPAFRELRCRHISHGYPFFRVLQSKTFCTMLDSFAGRQCLRAKSGWICPHKNFPLGSIAPNDDGSVICPLHGIRIDHESGRVLPRPSIPDGGPFLYEEDRC